jgi:large repetitive protein
VILQPILYNLTQTSPNYNYKNLVLTSASRTVSACTFSGTLAVQSINSTVSPATATFLVTPPANTNFVYQWYDENWVLQAPSNVLNPTFMYQYGNQPYNTHLVITFGVGCKDTITTPMNIPCSITVNAGSNQSVCTGANANLQALPQSGAAPFYYEWTQLGSSVVLSTAANATVTAASPGTVTYQVEITDGIGCTSVDYVDVTYLPQPVASISAPVTINCNTTSATLTATGGGTYNWSNGATTASISVTPAATTTYSVTVTATNGCTVVKSVLVTVDNTPPSVTMSAPVTLNCITTTATISATSGAGVTYAWNNGATTASISVTPTATTTYTVTVTGTNGCKTIKNVLITVDNFVPTISTGGAATITCASNTNGVALAASVPSPYTATSIVWSGNLANNSIVNPSTTTTYTVTITMANGCSGTATKQVVIDKTPPVSTISSTTTSLTCTISSATISVPVVAGASYLWSTGSIQSSITVSPSSNTNYSVTVTGANGCTSVSSQQILVNKNAPTCSAGADVTVTCTTPNATLTATAITNGGGAVSYLWSNGAATKTITVSPISATSYKVTVTDITNGCTASDDVTVFVDQTPPTMTVSALNPTVTCNNNFTYLSTTYMTGTYAWTANPASSTVYDWGTNYAYSYPNVTTIYTVKVTNPSNGCQTTGSVTVFVDKVKPTANAGADQTINCTNTTAQLNGSNSTGANGSPITYQWIEIGGNGTSLSSSQTCTVSPSKDTYYQLGVSNTNNGCTAFDTVFVKVLGKPTISINTPSTSTSTCLIPALTLSANYNSSTSTIKWYELGKPNIVLSSSATVQVTPSAQTDYVAEVTNIASGCTNSAQIRIYYNHAAPQVGTDPAGSDKAICSNGTATLGIAPGQSWNTFYAWDNGIVGNVPNPQVSPLVTTTYSVTITNTYSGCTLTDQVVVTVNERTTASIKLTAGSLVACTGSLLSAELTCTTKGSGPFTYQWFRTGINGSAQVLLGANSNKYTATTDGLYYCKVTGYCNVANSNAMQVTQPPTSKITVVGGGAPCANKTLKVTPTASGTPTYLWQYKSSCAGSNGWVDITSATSNTFMPSSLGYGTGMYKCKLTYGTTCYDDNNKICVTQVNCPTANPLTVANTKHDAEKGKEETVNEDMIEQTLEDVAGISLQVSPNPASERAVIKFNLPKTAHIRLILSDMRGMQRTIILEGEFEAGDNFAILDQEIQKLNSGIYFITLKVDDEIRTQKLIVLNQQ